MNKNEKLKAELNGVTLENAVATMAGYGKKSLGKLRDLRTVASPEIRTFIEARIKELDPMAILPPVGETVEVVVFDEPMVGTERVFETPIDEEAVKAALAEDPDLLDATRCMLELREMDLPDLLTRVEAMTEIDRIEDLIDLASDGSEVKRALEDRRAVLLRAPEPSGVDERGDRILEQGKKDVETIVNATEAIEIYRRYEEALIPEQHGVIEGIKRELSEAKNELNQRIRNQRAAIMNSTRLEQVETRTVLRGKLAITYRLDNMQILPEMTRDATPDELQEPLPLGRAPLEKVEILDRPRHPGLIVEEPVNEASNPNPFGEGGEE